MTGAALRVSHGSAQPANSLGGWRVDSSGHVVRRVVVKVPQSFVKVHCARGLAGSAALTRCAFTRHQRWVHPLKNCVCIDENLRDIAAAWQVEHRIEKNFFHDRAKASRGPRINA